MHQSDVSTCNTEDDLRVIVGSRRLGLIVPCRSLHRGVESGSCIDSVNSSTEVVISHFHLLTLCSIEAIDVVYVESIFFESEFIDADVVNCESS